MRDTPSSHSEASVAITSGLTLARRSATHRGKDKIARRTSSTIDSREKPAVSSLPFGVDPVPEAGKDCFYDLPLQEGARLILAEPRRQGNRGMVMRPKVFDTRAPAQNRVQDEPQNWNSGTFHYIVRLRYSKIPLSTAVPLDEKTPGGK